jgi:hypothetical protein
MTSWSMGSLLVKTSNALVFTRRLYGPPPDNLTAHSGVGRVAVRDLWGVLLVVAECERHGRDGASLAKKRRGRHGPVQRHRCALRRHQRGIGGWVVEHWGDQASLGLPVTDVGLSLLLTLALRPGPTHMCW